MCSATAPPLLLPPTLSSHVPLLRYCHPLGFYSLYTALLTALLIPFSLFLFPLRDPKTPRREPGRALGLHRQSQGGLSQSVSIISGPAGPLHLCTQWRHKTRTKTLLRTAAPANSRRAWRSGLLAVACCMGRHFYPLTPGVPGVPSAGALVYSVYLHAHHPVWPIRWYGLRVLDQEIGHR